MVKVVIAIDGLPIKLVELWAKKNNIEVYFYGLGSDSWVQKRNINWSSVSECRVVKKNLGNRVAFIPPELLLDLPTRDDPMLIEAATELLAYLEAEGLGGLAGSMIHILRVLSIPDGTDWEVLCDEEGEYVQEKHRVWR